MRRAPPFSTWLISTVLITSLLGILQWTGVRYENEREHAFYQVQQQRLQEYMSRTGSPRIVMLGNSLMRSATPFSALPAEPPLPWLRIYHATDDFAPFMALWPELLRNPPDTLIIHTELLLPRPGRQDRNRKNGLLDNLHDWKILLRTWRTETAARQQHYARLAHTYQALEGTGCGNLQASWPQVQRKMQARQHRYRRVPAVATTTQNVIVQAAQHITHVILLDIPRSQSVEARFGDDTATWLNAVQQQFYDIPNIRIMRLGEALGDHCYCDYRHMNPACQQQLTLPLQQLALQAQAL